MCPTRSTDPKTKLTAQDYFDLANHYLDSYQTLSQKIQSRDVKPDEKERLYAESGPILQRAYELQRMGFKQLTAQLTVQTEGLKDAVEKAADALKTISSISKVIQIASDLVAIAAVVAVPTLTPAALAALPALIEQLTKDVKP